MRFAYAVQGVDFLGRDIIARWFVVADASPSSYPDGRLAPDYPGQQTQITVFGLLNARGMHWDPNLNVAIPDPGP